MILKQRAPRAQPLFIRVDGRGVLWNLPLEVPGTSKPCQDTQYGMRRSVLPGHRTRGGLDSLDSTPGALETSLVVREVARPVDERHDQGRRPNYDGNY